MPPAHVVDAGTVSVPVMGRIAAGVPISAIQDHSHDLPCPPDLLSRGEHFALEVKGDSMIEAGIHDGDTVVIRRCDTADNGDIVVAVVEKEEATLKRLRKRVQRLRLKPPIPNMRHAFSDPIRLIFRGGWWAYPAVLTFGALPLIQLTQFWCRRVSARRILLFPIDL